MTAIETGCPYYLTLGSLAATFNVPSDPNFVGYLNDVTGLDMYGIRENAQVVAAGDGGYHGPFWRDRRPFTLSGFIYPTTPVAVRSAAQDTLAGVLGEALRADATLTWVPADGISRYINFRTQQPFRSTKGQSNVERNVLVAGVCRNWRIRATTQSNLSTHYASGWPLPLQIQNNGTADASPIFTIWGPMTNPVITNTTTGKKIQFNTPSTLAAGDTVIIDLTGIYPVVTLNGSDISYSIDPLNTDWSIAVAPAAKVGGVNNIQLSGSGSPTTATGFKVQWNDSWH